MMALSEHRHSCDECRETYTDECENRQTNGRCNPCISNVWSGYPFAVWPTVCCFQFARPAEAEEVEWFSLAGNTAWWVCDECVRTFGYDPTDEDPNKARNTARRNTNKDKNQ